MNPDVALFHWFNQFAGQSVWLDWLVRALVNDYAVPTLFAFVIGGLWFAGASQAVREANQRGVLYALLGLLLANLVVKVNWMLYFRPRPFAIEEEVKLLFYRPAVSSFPSEPVATLIALATGVWLYNRRVGWGLLALTIAFALARVIAGVHYPSDVLGGAAIGFLATGVLYRYVKILDRLVALVIHTGRQVNLA